MEALKAEFTDCSVSNDFHLKVPGRYIPYEPDIVLYDENEFERQVQKHSAKIKELFGKKPTSFRNTDFIYSDEIGEKVASMGYKTMLMEGAKHILGWRSPNYVYSHAYLPKLKLLASNFVMSNNVTFEFSAIIASLNFSPNISLT